MANSFRGNQGQELLLYLLKRSNAIQLETEQIMEIFLAKIDWHDVTSSRTVLQAVLDGNYKNFDLEPAQVMELAKKCDWEAVDDDKNTVLITLIWSLTIAWKPEQIRQAIEITRQAGVLDWAGDSGNTALHAAASNSPKFVIPLLEAGADYSLPNQAGHTAMEVARLNQKNPELAGLMESWILQNGLVKNNRPAVAQRVKIL